MEKNSLLGLSPLWLISLALVLGTFLATALPLVVLTKHVMPTDWLGFSGAIIGAACTIFAGWLAYSAVQVQIKDYRDAARKTAFAALQERFEIVASNIDRLLLAKQFLNTFAAPFPPTHSGITNSGGFAAQLRQSRMKALDFVSTSATDAPYGYGARISTVMSRVQRIGDRIAESQVPWQGTESYYNPIVMEAVAGIRAVASQIDGDIPAHQRQLEVLGAERDRFS